MVLPEDLKQAKKVFPSAQFEVKTINSRYKYGQTVFILLTKTPTELKDTKRLNHLNRWAWSRFVTRSNVHISNLLNSAYYHIDLTHYLPDTEFFQAALKILSD